MPPGTRRFPVLVLYDGTVLIDPPGDEVARALGPLTDPEPLLYDVTIVGAGPAGLAAAVYAASEGSTTTVIEPAIFGGQASRSSMIHNYFGFPWGIDGSDLAERGGRQAVGFGARLVIARSATGLRAEGSERIVTLSHGVEVRSRTVVLATGVAYRRLDLPGIEAFVGAGVFYGATPTEARALGGVDVCILGGRNSAGQAAVHLARAGARVTVLVRGNSLAKKMTSYLVQKLEVDPRIEVRLNTTIERALGSHALEGLVLHDARAGTTTEVAVAALFVFIRTEPRREWLPPEVARDDNGFVLTGRELADAGWAWALDRPPVLLETSMPGVFAAGDVRNGWAKRVAAAVGEGSTAVLLVQSYLEQP